MSTTTEPTTEPTQSTPDAQVSISNVGPIQELAFRVAPGVTILKGRNESGKSTAIEAVGALTGGGKTDLQARDGEATGIINGPGVTLVISRHARNVRSGELSIEAVDDRIDLSSLVEPTLKDGAARTRARIKALLALTQAEIPEDAWRKHDHTGVVPAEDITVIDPITTHGKVKRRLEAAARSQAVKAKDLLHDAERTKGSLDALGDLPDDVPSVEEATSQRREAMRLFDALTGERARSQKHREEIAAVQKRYEAALEASKSQAGKVQETKETLKVTEAELEDTQMQIRTVRTRIETLRAELGELQTTETRLADRIANTQEALATLESQQETIKALEEAASAPMAVGPSDEEIEAAEAGLTKAESLVDAARNAAEITDLRARHLELLSAAEQAEKTAVNLRASVKALDSVLADAIDSPYFTLIDGELYYTGHGEEGREPEPFDRLSDGKRWTVAIAAVAQGLHTAESSLALVGVSQTAWEALDSANRAHVIQAAVEARLAIVTAEHDDADSLHVEFVPEEGGAE